MDLKAYPHQNYNSRLLLRTCHPTVLPSWAKCFTPPPPNSHTQEYHAPKLLVNWRSHGFLKNSLQICYKQDYMNSSHHPVPTLIGSKKTKSQPYSNICSFKDCHFIQLKTQTTLCVDTSHQIEQQ